MKQLLLFGLISSLLYFGRAQEIPSRWDELTYSDWELALEKSNYTCILPIGILEKHGMGVPLGSDLIRARQWAARATKED